VDQTEVLVQKQNRVDENPPRCRVTVNQPDYEDQKHRKPACITVPGKRLTIPFLVLYILQAKITFLT